jgi:hypothetical protein
MNKRLVGQKEAAEYLSLNEATMERVACYAAPRISSKISRYT